MSKVELKDNHLHITYEVYDNGMRTRRKVIPIEDIECIKSTVGPRGGMHTWSVRGYDPEYSDSGYFKGQERDIQLYAGDRKDDDLIEKIMALLPKIKHHQKVEGGGAPW